MCGVVGDNDRDGLGDVRVGTEVEAAHGVGVTVVGVVVEGLRGGSTVMWRLRRRPRM